MSTKSPDLPQHDRLPTDRATLRALIGRCERLEAILHDRSFVAELVKLRHACEQRLALLAEDTCPGSTTMDQR
ncbi:MAG: hypothetical protein AB7F35_08430 [Acetobacteraceae bacterium]